MINNKNINNFAIDSNIDFAQSISEDVRQALIIFCLRIGDSNLALSQRLCGLLGSVPTLEEELATSNISLDYLVQANSFLDIAGKLENNQRDADSLAFFRDERQFLNLLISEQDTKDFAQVVVRLFLFSAYYYTLLTELQKCPFKPIAELHK